MPRSVVKSKTVRVPSNRAIQPLVTEDTDLDLMDLDIELEARETARQVVSGQAGATHPRFMSSDDMSL